MDFTSPTHTCASPKIWSDDAAVGSQRMCRARRAPTALHDQGAAFASECSVALESKTSGDLLPPPPTVGGALRHSATLIPRALRVGRQQAVVQGSESIVGPWQLFGQPIYAHVARAVGSCGAFVLPSSSASAVALPTSPVIPVIACILISFLRARRWRHCCAAALRSPERVVVDGERPSVACVCVSTRASPPASISRQDSSST
jgi:hypothetical protein